jgi:hypothetical protein
MSRIIIIGEGQTEQAFCNNVLQPYFNQRNIYIQNPTIKKTMGGIVKWNVLKKQIETTLYEDPTAIVTTLIDYYGLYERHKFPNWEVAERNPIKTERMEILEMGMRNDLLQGIQNRFIPYIQLHEFEGLLFSDIRVFDNNFEKDEFLDYEYLIETIDRHPNPEDINNSIESAPSKRLAKIIRGYYAENENLKVLYGSLLAHDIGIRTIMDKCPRFNAWINSLENI